MPSAELRYKSGVSSRSSSSATDSSSEDSDSHRVRVVSVLSLLLSETLPILMAILDLKHIVKAPSDGRLKEVAHNCSSGRRIEVTTAFTFG